ncbi:MAG: hypothetical protein Q9206_000214 [Seirophora lacunosa]
MLLQRLLCSLFLLLTAVGALRNAGGEKILLSQVKTLTLRHRLKTSHRRVPALPQLKCIGGNARGYYDVDIMRCKNQGADYEDENIQWTCTASLPSEFKLGTTDVICEGYESSSDPYVLKGSCGVEYRLLRGTGKTVSPVEFFFFIGEAFKLWLWRYEQEMIDYGHDMSVPLRFPHFLV